MENLNFENQGNREIKKNSMMEILQDLQKKNPGIPIENMESFNLSKKDEKNLKESQRKLIAMKNAKGESLKDAIEKDKDALIPKDASMDKGNFSDILKGIAIPDSLNSSNGRNAGYAYKYPDFQKSPLHPSLSHYINSGEGKNYRGKMRKGLSNFIHYILFYASKGMQKELMEEGKKFEDFYKRNFSINDYSIASIQIGKKWDAMDIQKGNAFLSIIKKLQGLK